MGQVTVITASDKTKIYNYEKAEEVFPKLKTKKFSRTDLVLILLCAQEKSIHGRILLMKELFLLYNKILKTNTQDPKFVPYRFGPYSFHLTDLLSTLHVDGYLQVKGRKNSNSESFSLTDKGQKYAKTLFNKLSKSQKNEITIKRKGWDQLGTDGILNYVYTHYPKYTVKSIIKNRYKDVIWGKGTG